MKALVTGIAGFIGNALGRRLVGEGWDVTGVDNLVTGQRKNLIECSELGIACIESDYASEGVLNLIRWGHFDIVFHVAAIPRVLYSIEQPALTEHNNVCGTVNLLDACVGNVDRFVFSSSSSVLGASNVTFPTSEQNVRMPMSPYALQKATCEDYCRLFSELNGLDTVCLRYFNVFGPGQLGSGAYSTVISAWCDALTSKRPLRLDGDGQQSRDFCYIDNVVDANIAAAKRVRRFNGMPINIAHGEEHSINDVLEMFKQRVGCDLDVHCASERPGDVRRTWADITRAREHLGWSPHVTFIEGLTRTFDWWDL